MKVNEIIVEGFWSSLAHGAAGLATGGVAGAKSGFNAARQKGRLEKVGSSIAQKWEGMRSTLSPDELNNPKALKAALDEFLRQTLGDDFSSNLPLRDVKPATARQYIQQATNAEHRGKAAPKNAQKATPAPVEPVAAPTAATPTAPATPQPAPSVTPTAPAATTDSVIEDGKKVAFPDTRPPIEFTYSSWVGQDGKPASPAAAKVLSQLASGVTKDKIPQADLMAARKSIGLNASKKNNGKMIADSIGRKK